MAILPLSGLAQDYKRADAAVSPSRAAAIAKSTIPQATVVGVKLLPNGAYAVTLRTDSAVERVMVDANDGSIR